MQQSYQTQYDVREVSVELARATRAELEAEARIDDNIAKLVSLRDAGVLTQSEMDAITTDAYEQANYGE